MNTARPSLSRRCAQCFWAMMPGRVDRAPGLSDERNASSRSRYGPIGMMRSSTRWRREECACHRPIRMACAPLPHVGGWGSRWWVQIPGTKDRPPHRGHAKIAAGRHEIPPKSPERCPCPWLYRRSRGGGLCLNSHHIVRNGCGRSRNTRALSTPLADRTGV